MSYKEQYGALAIDVLQELHLQVKATEFDLLRTIAWAYDL